MKNKKVIKEKLLKQLEEWMDWLETPNEDFGGYPVCPFLAPERKQNKLLIDFYESGDSIFDKIKEFDNDDRYTTALYIHLNYAGNYLVKEYQKFINAGLKEMGLGHLKSVCFNPHEAVTRNGVRTRSGAPIFLTSISTVESLTHAHDKIKNSNYWRDNRK
jgi:hypothetical protein|tara:strand:+ start:193 stop:672 length:480 start_codon:yes stop_codon:yes gene_type:complete